jgi:hypothetical protein
VFCSVGGFAILLSVHAEAVPKCIGFFKSFQKKPQFVDKINRIVAGD